MALPTMADGWSRATYLDWCRTIDEAPFSSISCGERVSFRNVEMLTTLAAAAALTERVEVFANLVIAPWHSAALLAKQLATIDVLSGGRLVVGVGVGGREQDYRAVGSPFARRHERLDEQVAELRRLWSGEPTFDGAPPLGPPPARPGGPPLVAGAVGPKAMARAAAWAEGISAFSFDAVAAELEPTFERARQAWREAGRAEPPTLRAACFYALGPDAEERLRDFTFRYLEVFGRRFAERTASTMALHAPEALAEAIEGVAATGCDELILVPATAGPACLEATVDVVSTVTRSEIA